MIIKLTLEGKLLDTRLLRGKGVDQAFSVFADGDASYIIIGMTSSKGSGGGDGWILREQF